MCKVYASIDPQRYASSTRSVRLNGFVTSVRLETEFWEVLTEIAQEQNLTLSQFIAQLHDEVEERVGKVKNLASVLRVACMVYSSRSGADGERVVRKQTEPLRVQKTH